MPCNGRNNNFKNFLKHHVNELLNGIIIIKRNNFKNFLKHHFNELPTLLLLSLSPEDWIKPNASSFYFKIQIIFHFCDQKLCKNPDNYFPVFFFFKFICLFWDRERQRERIPSRLCAGNSGELMNREIMTWAKTKSRMFNNWATQAFKIYRHYGG